MKLEDSNDNVFSMQPVTSETSVAEYRDVCEFSGATYESVEYSDAFGEGIHIQYAASSTGFKENIILDAYNKEFDSFQFVIKAPGFIPNKSEGKTISFVNEKQTKDTDEIAFTIEPTYMESSYSGQVDISKPETHITFNNYYTVEFLGDYEYRHNVHLYQDKCNTKLSVYQSDKDNKCIL